MCSVSLAALGVSAASTVVNHQAQMAQYRAQNAANRASAASLRDSTIAQYDALDARTAQERAQLSEQLQSNALAAAQARATAQVAAGEGGVAGRSIDAQLRDYFQRELNAGQAIQSNYADLLEQTQRDKQGLQASARNRLNALPQPTRPSFLAAGLRIGAKALDTYETHRAR